MDIHFNSPEKIILVIDTLSEPNATGFKANNGNKFSSLFMAKRVSEIFVHNKSSFNSKNEFAIMTLDSQNVNWHCDFTKVTEDLVSSLESIKETHGKHAHEKYFNIQPVFNLVHQHLSEDPKLLEDYVVRIILLYSRSNIIPKFNTSVSIVQELTENSNFFFDTLYMHELDCEKHKCKEIFTELGKLNIRDCSYILEVSRNAVELHNLMSMLYAHPKQRAPQNEFSTAFHPSLLKLAAKRLLDGAD